MLRATPTLRAVAVLAAAALALHELRYALAPDRHAADAGHAYLALVAPAVAALLAAACAAFVVALGRGGGTPAPPPAGFARLWLAASVALAATYGAQELLEGVLAAGHPAGLAAVSAHGGWIGFALAPAVGAAVALLLRGAHAILVRGALRRSRTRALPPAARRPPSVLGAALDPVARHLAGRGPPLASSSR